jgi:hypothetical protein
LYREEDSKPGFPETFLFEKFPAGNPRWHENYTDSIPWWILNRCKKISPCPVLNLKITEPNPLPAFIKHVIAAMTPTYWRRFCILKAAQAEKTVGLRCSF